MRIVRNTLVAFGALIAILVVIGLFLPARVHVERATTIDAPATAIFAIVNDFARFNEWSPWYPLDPDADYVVSKPARGAGASFTWHSDKPDVGFGSQQIIEAVDNRLVRVKLDFGDQGIALASYLLEPANPGSTRITWTMDADFGYDLVARYVGLMFDSWVGADYERGLRNLKALVESEYSGTGESEGPSHAEGDDEEPPGS